MSAEEPGTDRERGVDRLIELAEHALASGNEAKAFSLASQARVLSPGDPRIQELFRSGKQAPSKRRRLLISLGALILMAVVTGVAVAILIG